MKYNRFISQFLQRIIGFGHISTQMLHYSFRLAQYHGRISIFDGRSHFTQSFVDRSLRVCGLTFCCFLCLGCKLTYLWLYSAVDGGVLPPAKAACLVCQSSWSSSSSDLLGQHRKTCSGSASLWLKRTPIETSGTSFRTFYGLHSPLLRCRTSLGQKTQEILWVRRIVLHLACDK